MELRSTAPGPLPNAHVSALKDKRVKIPETTLIKNAFTVSERDIVMLNLKIVLNVIEPRRAQPNEWRRLLGF